VSWLKSRYRVLIRQFGGMVSGISEILLCSRLRTERAEMDEQKFSDNDVNELCEMSRINMLGGRSMSNEPVRLHFERLIERRPEMSNALDGIAENGLLLRFSEVTERCGEGLKDFNSFIEKFRDFIGGWLTGI